MATLTKTFDAKNLSSLMAKIVKVAWFSLTISLSVILFFIRPLTTR